MAMNADFMSVIPTEKSIDINQEDFDELADNYYDIDLWKRKFPENSWIFSGIGVEAMIRRMPLGKWEEEAAFPL